MVEIFKDIEGFEGLYQVSNMGRVKSLGNDKSRREKIRIPVKDKKGYLTVSLCKEGKQITKKVHRLVANAFIPNPLNLSQVNHKDENKTNNCVCNLEWCNNKYNCNYGTHNKRMAESMIGVHINNEKLSKKVLCVETGIIYPSASEAYRQTRINNQNISFCCKGKRKTSGGFHWQYV